MKGRKRSIDIIFDLQPPRPSEQDEVERQLHALGANRLAALAADVDFLGKRARTRITRVFPSQDALLAAVRSVERDADLLEGIVLR